MRQIEAEIAASRRARKRHPARRSASYLTPTISDAVMAEYLDVLTRPVLRPHAPRAQEVLALMDKFAVHVSPVKASFDTP